MLVPEAAVHENHSTQARKHDIRRPWQITPMKPESIAHSMQRSPDGEFRLRVSASDAPHLVASGLRSQRVAQTCLASAHVECPAPTGAANLPLGCDMSPMWLINRTPPLEARVQTNAQTGPVGVNHSCAVAAQRSRRSAADLGVWLDADDLGTGRSDIPDGGRNRLREVLALAREVENN